jgi:FkbM family methyltransferase
MVEIFYTVYAFLFGKKIFTKFNKFLYHLSLRGLGVLNYRNTYLTGENHWIKNFLKNKNPVTIIDVGANIGRYSKEILTVCPNACLFAFEPHPKTYVALTNNIESNNFKSFNLGVGDKNEKLTLYDYDKSSGNSHASLYKEVIEDIHKGKSVAYDISVVKLDDFLKEQKIDLLKIDTEGNELNVLLGSKNYLSNNKINAIHFEFNEMNIISRVFFKDFFDVLPNYIFYRLLPGGKLLEIKEYSPLNCEIFAFQNIIAILK